MIQSIIKDITGEEIEIEMIDKSCFSVSQEVKEKSEEIGLKPFSLGTFLGSMVKGKFEIHPAFLDFIKGYPHEMVVLNQKGSWLFLCGRDAFRESVIEKSTNSGTVLVYSTEGEVIGYGILRNGRVKTKLDKGAYLRIEK
jgi:ribosome biogenesis protein Nip4